MGRGKSKIEIKPIESLAARNVCFSKRRNGLFKKASDLCRLFPGVKVAAVVFSPAGKPYVYGDPTGILEQGSGSPLFPSPLSGDPVIRGAQLQGGCPSPSSVLAGDHLISEPCGYSPVEKKTGWEEDWLISGEDIESMIQELQGGDHLISDPSIQPEILREEDVGSMIQELLWS
ncbi:unnamed protein product [Cuscuta epithymum]|uniref:MADS-box domain-containing protein n=1 Tax=Cuscuta epithymum TaxID=186058 RepID=A0AAV0C4X2_9ASTE|nr:unnamed protein product [Cuscuta epithymum]